MPLPVNSLPACGHRHGERCLWPEHLNPGLRADFHCARLEMLVRDFDAFLDRAEAFGLDDAQMERIRRAAPGKTLPRSGCPLQKREETATTAATAVADCAFFLQGLCLQRLPVCTTPCPFGASLCPPGASPLVENE